MKTTYLLLILSLIISPLFSQDSDYDAVVSAVNQNILYKGLQNPVRIAVPGIKTKHLDVSVSNGTIVKAETGWLVEPAEVGELTLFIIADGNKVGEQKFNVKYIPTPTASFAGQTEGEIELSEALKVERILCDTPDINFDYSFKVVRYTFTYKDAEGYFAEMRVTGSKITEEIKSIISSFEPGNRFYFEDIRAKGQNGRNIMQLNDIALKIASADPSIKDQGALLDDQMLDSDQIDSLMMNLASMLGEMPEPILPKYDDTQLRGKFHKVFSSEKYWKKFAFDQEKNYRWIDAPETNWYDKTLGPELTDKHTFFIDTLVMVDSTVISYYTTSIKGYKYDKYTYEIDERLEYGTATEDYTFYQNGIKIRGFRLGWNGNELVGWSEYRQEIDD